MTVRSPLAGFLGNVATILKGTAFGQLVALAAMPVLTRLNGPDDFGAFQLYVSVSTLVIVVAAMRYEVGLLSAGDDAELRTGLRFCLVVNLYTAAIAAVVAATWYFAFAPAFHGAPVLAIAIPVSLLVAGIAQTLSYAALRQQDYVAVARSKLGQSLAFAGTGIAAGRLAYGAGGLVGADLTGRFLGGVLLARALRDQLRGVPPLAPGAFRDYARRYRELPSVSLPAVVVSNLGLVLTPILMFAAFGAATAGQYTLVERCVIVPLAFVAQAISQVFMGAFSQALRERSDAAPAMYAALVRAQLKLVLFPALLLFAFAPTAAELVFGPEWQQAGVFARIMAPVLVVSFVMAPVNMIFTMLGRHVVQFAWDASRLVVMLGVWSAIVALHVSPAGAMVLHAAATFLMQAAFVLLGFRECRRLRSGGVVAEARG